MTLNLMGIPTDLPLYDSEGNIIQEPNSFDYMPAEDNFIERPSTQQETQQAQALLAIVKEQLSKVDDIGADLTVSDLVNVFAEPYEGGSREYYTVQLFGGKNGRGIWSNYLKVLADLVLRLESTFDDVWIHKFSVDTLDDVFEVEIGVLTYLNQLNS